MAESPTNHRRSATTSHKSQQMSGGSGCGSSSSQRMSLDVGLMSSCFTKETFKDSSPSSLDSGSLHPLSCSICRDKYKNPKVLPCLHTFCECCLISYLPHESLTLTCPECTQQSILPERGVTALQTNFCVNSLSAHIDDPPSPSHQGPYLYCPSHKGQTLRFFCRDCDTAVCSSCTDIEHQRHSTIRVMDAVEEEKTRLRALLEAIQQNVIILRDSIAAADSAGEALSFHKEKSTQEINAAFDQLFQRLAQRRENLLKDLDTQFNVKLDQSRGCGSSLKLQLGEVEECVSLAEKALSHENETEILFVKKQIGERLQSYATTATPPLRVDSSLEFQRLSIDTLDTLSLGRVISSIHKEWAVSGDVVESRCVPIGRRHFLRLHLSTNHTPTEPLTQEDVQVSASIREVVYSLEQPHPCDNRSFIIRFLVSRVGPFALSVTIKQQHISGSPFQFHAYESEDRSATSSPAPFLGCANSPTGSRIPRANGTSPRLSTPTKRFFTSNGYSHSHTSSHKSNGHGSIHGLSSRRSVTLEDDLILKIGCRGRSRGEFTNPQGVVATSNGRLVVTDSNNQCVQIFDNTGEVKLRFGVRGRTVGQLQRPVGVAILPSTGNIAVADYDNKWVSIFDPCGKFMSRLGHGKLLGPKGLVVDGRGHLYVVDNKASAILIFAPTGKLLHKFGSRGNEDGQFAGPHFVAVNSKGHIIITDFHNHCVKVFDSEGDYLYSFGSNGEGNGQFNAPTGVAVDAKDNILVADWGNSRIQIFDSEGSFQGFVSTGVEPLYGPQGLTVTPDGYVAIADSGNHCVKLYKYG